MKRFLLFLLVLCPMLFMGQNGDGGGKVFGVISGTINVSMYGGATYYLPIDIPQGVNGIQPSLGIAYNSQSGNGLLGFGWNISGISTINRTGSTLFHNGKMTAADFSNDDCFMLDGQRLILVGSSGNNYEFKTENDEFSKIVFTKENGYFSKCEVRLENGNIIKYGYTDNSKLMAADGNNVIKWMVNSIADRNGNTISYIYETVGADSDIYIKRIIYTSNAQANLDAKYTITFTYSNNRFDDYHYFIAGNKVNCNRILSSIDIYYDDELLGTYLLSYDGNTNRMYNLLTEITYSRGIYALDPIVIQWDTDNNDIQNNTLYSQEINQTILDEFTFVGDFNGDGYSDLLTVPYKPSYGYSSSVTAKIYFNNQNGTFNSTPNYTLSLSPNLEWIHVYDANGDGYDDIIAQTLTLTHNGNDDIYHTGFTVYESLSGNGFSNTYSTSLEGRFFIRAGDFLGECRNSLALLTLHIVNDNLDYYTINGYPLVMHYDNAYSVDTIQYNIIDAGAVLADDFNGDGKTEIIVFDFYNYTCYSFYRQNTTFGITTSSDDFENDSEYASYYSGDFNNDGKADILFNYEDNAKYIAFSTGSGFSDWTLITNTTLSNLYLPQMRTYKHSLHYVNPNTSYGVNLSDIDGDGKSDIIFYDGNNRPVFFRDFHVTNTITNTGSFKIEFQANNEDIKFKNQYFTLGNFLGEDHSSFIAIDPQNPASTTDDKVKIFSFPSTSSRFSVGSITDNLGRSTSMEYEYLMPGNTDFYSYTPRPYLYDVKPYPMPMLAMKSYTQHIGTNNYKTAFKYGNILLHRTGRGVVNFEDAEKTTYINNIPTKLEKCRFELTTMGANAVALPQCDSTFIFSGGHNILSEVNLYTFAAARCSRQQTASGFRHIVRPAMTMQKTKQFNPDTPGQLLSVKIVEYGYNYQSNGTYNNTYGCSTIETGINGTDCNSAASCGYLNSQIILYKTDNHDDWIFNRKSTEVSDTDFNSKPTVTKLTKYEYNAISPYLIYQKTVCPSYNELSPLSVRYNYEHDACGNVILETTSAPNGIHNESSMITRYAYDNNYRMVVGKTKAPNGLAYRELYTYDKYDRMTSHTGVSGLTTSYYYYDPFSNYVIKTSPDNTTTSEHLVWATGDVLAPTGAVYFKQTDVTGGSSVKTFYDANSNTVRSITWNHSSNPVVIDTHYDERQQLEMQSYRYVYGDTPQWTEFEYDDWGRITSTLYPDGNIVRVEYDGLVTTTTSDVGNATRSAEQTVNYLGWVTTCTDASGAVVTYDYNPDGKMASMSTSGGSVVVDMEYDDAGNRTTLDDPDYGETTCIYDAYGRLYRQITPKGNRIIFSYDVLGRITQKTVTGDETTTVYQYNENTNKGTLASITHTGQTLTYTYDQYDRLVNTTDTRADTTYTTTYVYGSNSRLIAQHYPSDYKVSYEYYANGTLYRIKDIRDNTLWQTDDINACGQLLRATTGNGAVTTNTYDVTTNRLVGSATSNGIQNFAYTFDGFGNLTRRTDSIGTLKTETFAYDNLDRLTAVTLNNVSSFMVYDAYGRMTSKEKDGGTVFTQAQFAGQKPHATTGASVSLGAFPNMQTISYTALDKVQRIIQDSKVAVFSYGYDAQRIRVTVTDTLTERTRTKDYVGNCEFVDDNGRKNVYTYLTGPYGVFAVVTGTSGNFRVDYVYKDHLGSWTAVTDSVGTVIERCSFDAWGNMRDPALWTGTTNRPPKFDRGFTGHEHLYDFGLINMNGRMYDPALSSFLSPDNYMQDPTSQQGFNRYAYCMYNPLKYVDPSGNRYYGYDEGAYYRMMEAMQQQVFHEWYSVWDVAVASVQLTINMACGLFSHGSEAHGNSSGNHGSSGGGQDGPNKQRPLIIIKIYTTDNNSPYNSFAPYNNDESFSNNLNNFISEYINNYEESNKYFFIDGAAALDFMYENSFDENMNPYKELSAWVVDGGIIVQPWYDNKETESNNYYKIIDGNYYCEFQNNYYLIEAQIHTHPNYNNGNIGVSSNDLELNQTIPVYILYNSSLYKAGDPAIRLDQIRNINYYNWNKYFKY